MTSQHSTALSCPHLSTALVYRSNSRRVSRRSRHGLYAASQQQQQQQLVATEDSQRQHGDESLLASSTASPWCVILPNGKQFQLRELCTRNGRQSVWGCEATALLSTAEPVLVDQPPGDDNLSAHISQPPQQHTTGSLPALQHQEEQQAAQQHPWSQQWQDAFQQEQQQLRPLSAYHMKRLRWQQQQLHQQVLRQQQQQQAHLQQELEDFSQRAASLHQPTGTAADQHVMLQPLVSGNEAEAAGAAAAAAGPAAADAIKQLHLSTAQVPGPWAAAAPVVEGTAADADAAVRDSLHMVDTFQGTVPAAPAAPEASLLQPQPNEQAGDAGDTALGLQGSAGTTGPTAAAAAAEAAAMSARKTVAAGETADSEGLYSAAGGLQDDVLTPRGLYAPTLQLPLAARGEEMLAWSFAEVETAGAAAAAATAGLSAPAAAGAAREQIHGSVAAPGTGQPAAAGVPALPTAQAAVTAAVDDAGAAALEAATVAEVQALFTEQLQHQLELLSAPPKPAAAAALGAEAAAAPTATTAADASFATSGAADMLSWSLSEPASTTEPVPAANRSTSEADPAGVTADGRAAVQSPGTLVSTQQQQQQQQPPAAAAGLAVKPLEAEQLLGVQSVLLKEQQQQQAVGQVPVEAQQHTSTADDATLSALQPSVVQLQPAASERQQQQGAQGPASAAVSSRARKLLRQIDQSRTCWELGLLVMQHTSYAPGLNSSKALQVNLEDWTPVVVAAALERFRKLASYTLVAHLRNKEVRQQQHQLRQHHPAPLGSLQGDLSSPGTSSRSSSSRRQDGAGDDDAEVQPHLTSSQHIKTLMRVLLRLMDMLELQLTEVPSRALREAAVCSANLLGRSCTQSTWWRRARGYMVLGEAALRLKEGRMPVSYAIQVCYSYSHCDYPPTQLLQVLMQQVQDRPGVLEQQTLTTLCRFTYCVTRHRPQLTGFDQGALTAAVLQALPLQNLAAAGLAESVEAMTGRMYDLVMLLRHLCQLNFKPPAGVLRLMPALMTDMSSMTMQELCTVLHIAVAWDLPQKQELAAAAAEAAMSAAGLQQQQQAQSGPATGGSLRPISSSIRLSATTQEPSGPVARTAADAVLLLHRFCCLGYQPPQPLTQHLLGFIGPKLHELSLLQAELLRRPLVHIWRSPAYCQQLVQACFTQWMSPQQHVSTSSSITDHGSSNGTSSSHVSTGTLHARLAQQAHVGADTAEQQYVLQPALLRLPYCQLKALLVAAGRFGLLANEMREQQRLEDWQLQQQLHQQQEQQQEQQQGQQARHYALRQQLQEALSGSPVPQQEHEAMIAAAQPAQQTPALGSASQAVGCISSLSTRTGLEQSGEPVSDSCHSMAAAFISTVLNTLTPAVLAEWRADLVLALLWSAARLKLQVSQQLLQAGAAVMRAGLRQQIAARELVLLMWTAAALKMNDPDFLEGLCGRLAHCANQLAPSSIASAAWALVELRCPHSVLLGVLSRELLRPLPWLSSHQAFKIRKWHRRRSPSRQQQRQLQQQLLPWAVQQEAAAAFNSRYSDAAAWGSVQRPMPRSKEQLAQHRQPAAAAPTKRRPPRRGRRRAARRNSTAGSVSYQASSPQSLSLSPAAAGVLGYVHEQHLLDVHPRVRQLGAADVAKLVCSCCCAGWAPPHLFAVLAVRLVELMPQMDPATLVQVMWAYSTAGCCDGGLLQAAARCAASLASRHAFDSSRQLLSLLASFRAMGLLKSEAQAVLQELERLQVSESLQAV